MVPPYPSHGFIFVNDSNSGAGDDIPFIKPATDFILFLAVIIIVVRLNTIVRTKITIIIIQIYFIIFSYDIGGFDTPIGYILFIKKIFFLNWSLEKLLLLLLLLLTLNVLFILLLLGTLFIGLLIDLKFLVSFTYVS